MEIIGELILGLITEIIIPLIFELVFEALARSLAEPFMTREYRNAALAGIGYFLIGLIVGGFSLLVAPQSFVRSETFHGISLVITPLVCGLVMALIGRWRLRQGKTLLRLDTFVYGFIFAFPVALVRFLYTT